MARLQIFLYYYVASLFAAAQALNLNITALTGYNNISVLECWQLTEPLAASTVPGRIGSLVLPLGNMANASYGVIPARFDGGLHNAPKKQ